ncbi:MAG: response regulator [Nitrospirae bacterium]|nr:response regulator [Nitrospirota bacterium]
MSASIAFSNYTKSVKETIARQQFVMLSALADEIDMKLLTARQQLIAVAKTAPPDIMDNPAKAQAFLDSQVSLHITLDNHLFLFPPSGRIFVESPYAPGRRGFDLSYRNYIKKTVETKQPYTSDPYISTQRHKHPVIMLTAPLFDRRGKLKGILSGSIDLMRDNFLGQIENIKVGSTGYLWLTTSDRVLIMHSDKKRIFTQLPPGKNLIYDKAVAGFEGTDETTEAYGRRMVTSFKRLKDGKWILAANYPADEAYSAIHRTKKYFVTITIAVIGALFFIVSFLVKYLTQPLTHLTRHIESLPQKKEGDRLISIETEDEIGVLSSAFNKMVAEIDKMIGDLTLEKEALERAYKKIDAWNIELEDTVAARTKTLRQTNEQLKEEIAERMRVEGQLKESREEADAASRAKSEFLANMSHEIRTPMNAIIGMSELLMDSPLGPEQQEYAEAVKQSADSLLGLINSVLDFSKIEAGKLELEEIDFDLNRVIFFAVNIFSAQVIQKGIVLKVDMAEEVPIFLRGDPVRLRQILINLIGNAVKFTRNGLVTLEVRRHHGEDHQHVTTLLFSVRDTGIGIPGDKMERIFESFTQADGSTTRRYGGTGLGLNIAMNLVKLMGGAIWVESEVGKGSIFHFTARFSRGVPVEASISWSPVSFSTTSPLRILHVEDNIVIRNYVSGMLGKSAHKVKSACNGKEAIELLSREEFDVVLMDIQMPDMDGFEVVRTIRDRLSPVKNHAIPVIAATAHAMKGDRERCIESGMNDYIAKPFNMTELFKKIGFLLPATPKGKDVIDQASLDRLYGLNVDVIRKICSDFLVNVTPDRLDDIREAVAARDADAAGRLAHSLKGAAGTIGAKPLQDAALQMELAAKRGDMEQANILFNRLQNEFNRLVIFLQKHE